MFLTKEEQSDKIEFVTKFVRIIITIRKSEIVTKFAGIIFASTLIKMYV